MAPLPTLLLLSLAMATQEPDTTPSVENPFSGFETHLLSNGVKVWYGRVSGAPNATVSVAIPYGHDQDPPGKEELAHFTEHMLFSDHGGRSEQEIKEEIESLGGRRNGFTTPDRTFYYVTIPREHGLLAVEWMGRLMEPHAMRPEVVERNRQPVANEIGARPRELGDWITAALDPAWLRLPDFWEREFGLETRAARRWDRWARLYDIAPDDLRGFYERHYAPGAMTLAVVGDLPRDSVLATAERAFGGLVPRPVPEGYDEPEDPARYRKSVSWNFAPRPRYRTLFKLFRPGARDHVLLLFVRDFLDRRLDDRLRFGERKAVYGVSVGIVQRGPVMHLSIDATVDAEDLAWARGVVEEELESLREGRWPPGSFEADRRALVEQLRSRYRDPEALDFLVYRHFYDRELHGDFPDLLTVYDEVEAAELASFARSVLVRPRRVEWIRRPHPLGQAGVAAGAFLLLLVSARAAGRALTTPVRMDRIRYVARIRLSLPFLFVVGGIFAAGGAATLRLYAWLAELFVRHGVAPVDSYAVHLGAWSFLGAAGVGLTVAYLSLLPRKILVFPDHVRVKYLSYRSRLLEPEDVREASLRRFADVWLTRGIFRTLPLTTGLFRPGIHLSTRSGADLFFRSRDTEGLHRALIGVLEKGEGSEAPADGR